jgi:sterol desaturase/sphingolipid hydroxylase (fatty acid hydroxylase superfamily)
MHRAPPLPPAVETPDADRSSALGTVVVLTFVGALAIALLVRGGQALVGLAVLFLVFVPLERWFALRPQKVFRRGLLTDLTHLLVDGLVVGILGVVFAVVLALPLIWVRPFGIAGALPLPAALVLGLALAFLGNYVGHRLTHSVPFLWRFHSVHHSIERMDWVASARLHPIDQAFTQACAIAPLVVLGFGGGAFAGIAVFFTLLALFQHANVRLRFPGLRWVINTPEWHHWHHAVDPEARDKNFGLPVIDRLFGTAYLPKGRRPSGFGVSDPVPDEGWWRHLAYPFTRAARAARAA